MKAKYVWVIIIFFIFATLLANVKADKEPNNCVENAEPIYVGTNFGSVDIDDLTDIYKIKVSNNTLLFLEFTTSSGVGSLSLIVNGEKIRSLKSIKIL